jgi:D-alanyl-D-alanine carboxypeptidase
VKHSLTVVAILLCFISVAAQSGQGGARLDKDFRKIQRYLGKATGDGLMGVVVHIQRGPSEIWTGSAGVADKETNEPMEGNRIFSLASVGKMYTAVATLKLVEKGMLKLDDKVSEYLPEEIITNLPNGPQVTIRHLLGNTSGWQNYDTDTSLNRLYLSGRLNLDTLSRMNALRRYGYGKPELAKPGKAYHYSSTNYLVLAMILDKVVPEGHTVYLRNLLASAGLGDTYYRETPPARNVHYYGDLNQDDIVEDLTSQTFETTNWFTGDDGVYAPAGEAARFIRLLMEGAILSQETLSLMKTGNTGIKTDTGLGLMADKSFPYGQLYGHSGRGIGVTADVYYFPKRDISVVILCNTGLRGSAPKFRKAYLKMRSRIVKKLFLF